MKSKLLSILLGGLTALILARGAEALPFYDLNDQPDTAQMFAAWDNDTSSYDVRTADVIQDTSPFMITHTVNFNPAADQIVSATLSITHAGNDTSNGAEAWLVTDTGNSFIGYLSDSVQVSGLVPEAVWTTDVFNLDSSFFSGVSGPSWTIVFKMQETTSFFDQVLFDKSELSGEYTSVPEPTSILLLGTGLAGLACTRKRKKNI